jgi:hypothetical protein
MFELPFFWRFFTCGFSDVFECHPPHIVSRQRVSTTQTRGGFFFFFFLNLSFYFSLFFLCFCWMGSRAGYSMFHCVIVAVVARVCSSSYLTADASRSYRSSTSSTPAAPMCPSQSSRSNWAACSRSTTTTACLSLASRRISVAASPLALPSSMTTWRRPRSMSPSTASSAYVAIVGGVGGCVFVCACFWFFYLCILSWNKPRTVQQFCPLARRLLYLPVLCAFYFSSRYLSSSFSYPVCLEISFIFLLSPT